MYAICLFSLAVSTLLRINRGISFGFAIDALEAIAMCIFKLLVAVSAALVHWHLSSLSRVVASLWVLCLATSKFVLAMCMLILVAVYATATLSGGLGSLCTWGFGFCWTLIVSLVCECVAAFAMCRLQQRAVAHVRDPYVFNHIIGNSWLHLIGGTLGSGLGLGVVAALLVFDNPHDNFSPFTAFGFFYLGAAVCQLIAGLAMLQANFRIRQYFFASTACLVAEEAFDTPSVEMAECI
jgi:hypothetical protein